MNIREYLQYRARRVKEFWSENIPTRHPYSLLSFLLSLGVLGFGMAFRPESKVARPLSESDLGRFQPSPQRRQIREIWQNFPAAAALASERLIHLSSEPHTAIIWDAARAITVRDLGMPPYLARATLVANSQFLDFKPIPSSATVPFRLWAVPSPYARDVQPPDPAAVPLVDDWVIAVARAEGDQTLHAEGSYQGRTNSTCGTFAYKQIVSSVHLSSPLVGGGLFTLDGKLLGVIVACNGEPAVVSVDTLTALLAQPVPVRDRLRILYGMRVGENDQTVRVLLVWAGSIAGASGLRAGDLIRAVDDQPVHSFADLQALNSAEGVHEIEVERNRRKLSLLLAASPEQPAPTSSVTVNGVVLKADAAHSQIVVDSVAPSSPWSDTGLEKADVVLRVDNAPVRSLKEAAAALTRRRTTPLHLEIIRENNTAEVLLPNE